MTEPLSNVYCTPDDLGLRRDMLPRDPEPEWYIQQAADLINSYVGQIYRLPLDLDPLRPDHLADILLLKRINAYAAAGQILMNHQAATEDGSLHAYGSSMYNEAKQELARITAGRTVLESAEPIEEPSTQPNGPLITNRDAGSFVDAFYTSNGTAHQGIDTWGAASG